MPVPSAGASSGYGHLEYEDMYETFRCNFLILFKVAILYSRIDFDGAFTVI